MFDCSTLRGCCLYCRWLCVPWVCAINSVNVVLLSVGCKLPVLSTTNQPTPYHRWPRVHCDTLDASCNLEKHSSSSIRMRKPPQPTRTTERIPNLSRHCDFAQRVVSLPVARMADSILEALETLMTLNILHNKQPVNEQELPRVPIGPDGTRCHLGAMRVT